MTAIIGRIIGESIKPGNYEPRDHCTHEPVVAERRPEALEQKNDAVQGDDLSDVSAKGSDFDFVFFRAGAYSSTLKGVCPFPQANTKPATVNRTPKKMQVKSIGDHSFRSVFRGRATVTSAAIASLRPCTAYKNRKGNPMAKTLRFPCDLARI